MSGKERHVPALEAPDAGGTPMRAIRTAEYLFVRNLTPDRWPAGTPNYEVAQIPRVWYGDVDNGPTKTYMIENRNADDDHRRFFALAFEKRPAEELYDLTVDPAQLTNIAHEPAYAAIVEELSQRLDQVLEASEDPRLRGEGDRLERYPYYGMGPRFPGWEP